MSPQTEPRGLPKLKKKNLEMSHQWTLRGLLSIFFPITFLCSTFSFSVAKDHQGLFIEILLEFSTAHPNAFEQHRLGFASFSAY